MLLLLLLLLLLLSTRHNAAAARRGRRSITMSTSATARATRTNMVSMFMARSMSSSSHMARIEPYCNMAHSDSRALRALRESQRDARIAPLAGGQRAAMPASGERPAPRSDVAIR